MARLSWCVLVAGVLAILACDDKSSSGISDMADTVYAESQKMQCRYQSHLQAGDQSYIAALKAF